MLRFRRLPSPALCLALVAVVLAGAGTSYGERAVSSAVATITGKQIKQRAIKAKHLRPGAVKGRGVKDGTLLAQDCGSGQIPAGQRGPAGSAGPQGPTGAPGAVGPQGPAALAGWEKVSGVATVGQ